MKASGSYPRKRGCGYHKSAPLRICENCELLFMMFVEGRIRRKLSKVGSPLIRDLIIASGIFTNLDTEPIFQHTAQLVLKDKIFLGQEIPKSHEGYRNNL
jgi:hypothetical protein